MLTWIVWTARASLVALAIGWGTAIAATDAVIGSVLAVRGNVSVDAGRGPQPLTVNTPLHASDTIVSTSGKAKLALADGTIISVGENTRVRLAEYDSSAGAVKARVNVVSGALRFIVDKVAPAGRFEVHTETAIAAVRGTDWLVDVTSDQTAVAVVSGVVAVSSLAADAPATVVLDGRGQGTDVRRGRPPTPPAVWGAQRFENTLARATFE
jgi:hypothetical protein